MQWEEFKKNIPDNWPDNDVDMAKRAFILSSQLHHRQKRKSGEPYFNHPVRVAQSLMSLKLDASCIAAALLHDVVEDNLIKLDEIKKKFSEDVARLIEGVTKVDKIKYRGLQRSLESLRKMFLAVAEDIRVVLIKLHDRRDNMRTLHALREDKKQRIAQETLELYAPLAYRLGMYELSSQLEDLAFQYVYPEKHAWIMKSTKTAIPERQEYLKHIKPAVLKVLAKNNVKPIDVQSRAKHYYSLYKKLLRYNMDWGTIYDLVAMRIIVPEIADCYKVLGAIHAQWRPVPGRIKDYIALPKPNGYRSLHTTVFCVDNKITEFQIRTPEMNDEAEFGIAAHWAWHEAGKPRSGVRADEKKMSWVKQLQEWHKEVETISHEESFENLKIDFFRNRIFVLTPKGDVIDLPEGSTPIDFAYHVHSEIGNQMINAKVNGAIVPFSYKLRSGQTVEVATQKNKKPTSDWLEYAVTSMARHHIKRVLRGKHKTLMSRPINDRFRKIRLCAKDRIGLLKDISSAFVELKINIDDIATTSKTKSHHFITISFKPSKTVPMPRLITHLRQIKGVTAIEMLN